MSRKNSCTLTSPQLETDYTEFILSRMENNSSQATLEFYYYTCGKFLEWVEKVHGVTKPDDITRHHVRLYIVGLQEKGRKDTTVWNNARAIKTMFKFWCAERIMQAAIEITLPKLLKKKLPRLSPAELDKVLKQCKIRDRAILVFMADSGLRRQEIINLNWDDVNMQTGLVSVRQGKGGKDRSAVVGARCRRVLLAYRRSLPVVWMEGVLFKTDEGTRFTSNGMLAIFRRLRKRTGVHVSPHMLRRTWTILSLRSGMDSLYLQHLGGWEDMTMLDHYASIEDMDLLRAHRDHSPYDNLEKLKREEPP
jgi:site-specific recombinase XerD